MVVLGGGAVSYERGTPVHGGRVGRNKALSGVAEMHGGHGGLDP